MCESFECANCQKIVELDEHGGCPHCGSRAVLSTERIPAKEPESVTKAPTVP